MKYFAIIIFATAAAFAVGRLGYLGGNGNAAAAGVATGSSGTASGDAAAASNRDDRPKDVSGRGDAAAAAAAAVGLFADLGTVTVPAGTDVIMTSGRDRVGLYPARYVRDADQTPHTAAGAALIAAAADRDAAAEAVAALLGRIRKQDASGAWWVIDDTTQEVHAGHFGAVPDANTIYNPTTNKMTGTDSTPAIQALIDWRMYFNRDNPHVKAIRIPAGVFRLASGLQAGYGDRYAQANIEGAGMAFAQGFTQGTTLLCDFDNQPGIAFSGGLWPSVRNLSLFGRASHWYDHPAGGGELASYIKPAIDDTLLSNWFNPAIPAHNPELRYCPYAGIAIDPYKGDAPGPKPGTDRYPDAAVPAWLPAAARTTYGRNAASTYPLVERVSVRGFAVGIACQPCDSDGNGDFLTMRGVQFKHVAVGLSVGNTQSRNVHFDVCSWDNCHTAITTSMHGRRNGRLQGVAIDCTVSDAINILDLRNGSAIFGPITFTQLYAETVYRIGHIVDGAASVSGIKFDGCSFNFHLQNAEAGGRGVPRYILGNPLQPGQPSGGGSYHIAFDNCTFSDFATVLTLEQGGVVLRESQVRSLYVDRGFSPDVWKRLASNSLAGGLVVPNLNPQNLPHRIKHTVANVGDVKGSDLNVMTEPMANWTGRNHPASLYCQSLSPAGGRRREAIANVQTGGWLDKSTFAANRFEPSTGVWTFTANRTEADANADGLHAGGVIYDRSTGLVFWIESRTGAPGAYAVTAHLQNGYRVNAGGATRAYPEGDFAADVGEINVYGGRFFTPHYPTFFDTTNASDTLANVERGDGFDTVDATAGSAIQAGDWIYVDHYVDAWTGDGKVLSIGPGTLTVRGMAMDTKADRRLELVQRAQP